ncbi:MAG: hypothetical protein R3F60_11895 [bacterium]
MFRLQPWEGAAAGDGLPVVPVTVSADDPLQLATRLSDELAYAWAGMVQCGVAPSVANAWLQRCTVNAWRGRFAR